MLQYNCIMYDYYQQKFLKFFAIIFKKIKPRFSFHYVAYSILFFVAIFSVVNLVTATTPNPGHPWSELGDGVFSFTNGQTVTPYTYTFPSANSTVLTTNAAVTVGQGGTGSVTFITNGILYGNGTGSIQALAPNAGATECLTQTSSGAPAWGSCGSSGTVTTIGVTTANGVSGTSSGGATPSLTISLGAITPTTVNGLTLASATDGFSIAGGTTSRTLTISGADASVSGTNTGDNAANSLYAGTITSGAANSFWATPNGSAGVPSLRGIVAADIPTLNQSTTGSAGTLTTPRSIYGNSFNGSADLAQTISVAYGGTGINGFAIGDMIYANSTTTLTTLAGGAGNNGKFLTISGGVPTWATLPTSGATWTPQGTTTLTVGGITSGTNLGTNPISIETTIRNMLYPYIPPAGNITTSFSTGSAYIANSTSASNVTVTWGVTKSAADSNGSRYFIHSATSVTPTRAAYVSGTQPSSTFTSGQGNDTSTGNNMTYTPTTGSFDTLGGTAVFTFTAYQCSAVQPAAGSACTQGTSVGGSVTITYRSPVFYGVDSESVPSNVNFAHLTATALASTTARTASGAQALAPNGTQYMYYAWPQSYDPGGGCYYNGHASGTHCLYSTLGDIDNFERGTQTYNGINYYVYRGPSIGGGGTMAVR